MSDMDDKISALCEAATDDVIRQINLYCAIASLIQRVQEEERRELVDGEAVA